MKFAYNSKASLTKSPKHAIEKLPHCNLQHHKTCLGDILKRKARSNNTA